MIKLDRILITAIHSLLLASLLVVPGAPTAAASTALSNPVYLPLLLNHNRPTNPIYRGDGTYYLEADGNGNCAFGPSDDLMVAAINDPQWNGSALCGAYAHVTGPKGEVTVRIVDRCPECLTGDLDLSPQAFEKIADISAGRVKIMWEVISAPALSSNIGYYFNPDSNPWWIAVQIRNHRNPIASVEFSKDTAWVTLPRQDYNFFTYQSAGPAESGPFTFRVTDIYGNVLVDTDIAYIKSITINGAGQFPPGP